MSTRTHSTALRNMLVLDRTCGLRTEPVLFDTVRGVTCRFEALAQLSICPSHGLEASRNMPFVPPRFNNTTNSQSSVCCFNPQSIHSLPKAKLQQDLTLHLQLVERSRMQAGMTVAFLLREANSPTASK